MCRSCTQSLDGHPDVFTIVPSGATIKIEQVRAIQRELLFSPTRGRRKVFRFVLADNLTEQAQNALLKSLEEPPPFVTFLLLSRHVNAILPTVRSRCVHVRFGRVPTGEVARALQDRGVSAERAERLAALSFGRPGVIDSAEVDALLERRKQVVEWAEYLFHRPDGVWYVGEEMEKVRDQAPELVDHLIMWFRDLLLVRTGRPEAVANLDMVELLQKESSHASPAGLAQAIRALLALKEHWKANANFRLALDVALINIQRGLRSA